MRAFAIPTGTSASRQAQSKEGHNSVSISHTRETLNLVNIVRMSFTLSRGRYPVPHTELVRRLQRYLTPVSDVAVRRNRYSGWTFLKTSMN